MSGLSRRGMRLDDCAETARMDEGKRNTVRANVLSERGKARECSRRHEADGVLCEPPFYVWLFPDPQPEGVCCDVGVVREEVFPVPRPLFVDVSVAALSRNS